MAFNAQLGHLFPNLTLNLVPRGGTSPLHGF